MRERSLGCEQLGERTAAERRRVVTDRQLEPAPTGPGSNADLPCKTRSTSGTRSRGKWREPVLVAAADEVFVSEVAPELRL
jgi:hypothetical protein